MNNKKIFEYFKIFMKGIFMGIADAIPGVSGGTIALLLGIYEELITTISNIKISLFKILTKDGLSVFWKKGNLGFLFPLLIGIIASLIIAFMISLDEFIIAFFLTGTEPTLPVYLYSQLRFPAKLPIVMSLGTILLMLSLILVTTAEYFRRRGIHKSSLDQKNIGGAL